MTIGKSREELYEAFKTGAKPSGADFKDLIDSAVNSNDDGIAKPAGDNTPLKINARGDTENLLDFYAGDVHTWRINQKPTPELAGLNFATATDDNSRLFIDSSTGKVGLSTTAPQARLHIQQNGSEDALRIEDQGNDTTPLVVDASGNVGIGKRPNPSKRLDVRGHAEISGTLEVSNTVTAGSLRAGNGVHVPNKKLSVRGDAAIVGSLDISGTLDTQFLKVVRGNQTNLVVDASGNVGIGKPDPNKRLDVYGDAAIAGSLAVGSTLNARFLDIRANAVIRGTLEAAFDAKIVGTLEAKSLKVVGNRPTHDNNDGTIYRKDGQVFLTVDDNLYIRDSRSSADNVKFHFDTDKGTFSIHHDGNVATIGVTSETLYFELANSRHGVKRLGHWDGDHNIDAK